MSQRRTRSGFTLIELSIVLVIIGLIVGGVLVGRDLIRAAAVRAQISQIEKFNTAANTFLEKYGYLPGDIRDPEASRFGFIPRGPMPGLGDGDGLIAGYSGGSGNVTANGDSQQGETSMFWLDLAQATLIEGAVNGAGQSQNPQPWGIMPFAPITSTTSPSLGTWFPTSKLRDDNYILVHSANGQNYFTISGLSAMWGGGFVAASANLPVRDAAAIDSKIDDGLPQSGRVTAQYLNPGVTWSGASDTSAVAGSPSTCYDNGNVAGGIQRYSVSQNNGNGGNCALSFQFQ